MPGKSGIILLFFILPLVARAQPDSLVAIKGIPTKQIFDLMVDSRNFLWIGHDLGLSRFDGSNFTHFSCKEQNSLGLSEILEDPQGRVWCRNFTGQIFYVEHEKMQHFTAYDNTQERFFPRMLMTGDWLVASSVKGLFTWNTKSMQGGYISCGGMNITSLSLVQHKVVAFGEPRWFLFDPAGPPIVKELQFPYPRKEAEAIHLQPCSYNDTIFSFSPRSGETTRFVLRGGDVIRVSLIPETGFLNTINFSGMETWIHTKTGSRSLETDASLSGFDLTDLVEDKEGNTWYSSFKYGLLVKYRSYWEKMQAEWLQPGEAAIQMGRLPGRVVYGTSMNRLVVQDSATRQIRNTFSIPVKAGPLIYMRRLDDSCMVIASSLWVYLLKPPFREPELVTTELSLKNAVKGDTCVYLAAASGLHEMKSYRQANGKTAYTVTRLVAIRCRWVDYNPYTKKVLVAFKDGLSYLEGSNTIPVLFNGQHIATSSMHRFGPLLYISTFGNGMLQMDENGITRSDLLDHMRPYPVFRSRTFSDTTWLLGANYLLSFNPVTGKSHRNVFIPPFPDANVNDIAFAHGKLHLLTNSGAYMLHATRSLTPYPLRNYLLKISVNNRDTTRFNKLVLPHNRNNLDFFVSAPFFSDPDKIHFRFRMLGSENEEWEDAAVGESVFRFSSLRPGHYVFEAVAVHSQWGDAPEILRVPFRVKPVWYQATAAILLFILLMAGLLALIAWLIYKARLKKQRLAYERNLAIQGERNRISSEIHDDIGASLSGLRLQTELLEQQAVDLAAKENLGKIHHSMKELSESMQEVIWSLNSRQDTLEDLLHFTQKQAGKLFENSGILLETRLPDTIPSLSISSDKRADIYLTVKEALHNALKHAKASTIRLDIGIEEYRLKISVSDNGRGFDPQNNTITGNGLINMRKRVSRLGGTLEISGQNGTSVVVEIPLKG